MPKAPEQSPIASKKNCFSHDDRISICLSVHPYVHTYIQHVCTPLYVNQFEMSLCNGAFPLEIRRCGFTMFIFNIGHLGHHLSKQGIR